MTLNDSKVDSKTRDFRRMSADIGEQHLPNLSLELPLHLPQRWAYPELGGVPCFTPLTDNNNKLWKIHTLSLD